MHGIFKLDKVYGQYNNYIITFYIFFTHFLYMFIEMHTMRLTFYIQVFYIKYRCAS